MSHFEQRFDTSKMKNVRAGGVLITSFTMREVDGQDEEVAAGAAKARGGSISSAEELIRLSIVAVNDQPVKQPYLAFDTWNSRARQLALKAWTSLNGVTEEEGDAFLSAASPVEGQQPGGAASVTG
jgi:hypothetical protein